MADDIAKLKAENKQLKKQIEELRSRVLSQPSTLAEMQLQRIRHMKHVWRSMISGLTGSLREFIATAPMQIDVHELDGEDWLRLDEFKQAYYYAGKVVQQLEQARDGIVESVPSQVG